LQRLPFNFFRPDSFHFALFFLGAVKMQRRLSFFFSLLRRARIPSDQVPVV
jgi:hypothetical protein